jgi:osmotically inducible protein OsmC
MKPFARKASVLWQEKARTHGKRIFRASSQGLKVALYEVRGNLQTRGSNPPELIAAAHAGSFALTLANELAEAGYRPRQIEATSVVTMESIAARWTLAQIRLEVIATVPQMPECDFVDAALRAKANCPIARALNANISMRAKLRNNMPRTRPKLRGAPAGPGKKKPEKSKSSRGLNALGQMNAGSFNTLG